MASYEEFESMIGPLKRAAIDAYMRDDGWVLAGSEYQNIGGEGQVMETIDRPDENGSGGGGWEAGDLIGDLLGKVGIGDRGDEYVDRFGTIRGNIDDLLDRWKGLPEPTDIAKVVELMRQAQTTLSVGASNEDGTVSGGGDLAATINSAVAKTTQMGGGMIATFQRDWLNKVGLAVRGQHAVALVIGQALAPEEKIWEQARQAVADAVDSATKSFDGVANGGGVDWDVVVKITGYALAGASIFAPQLAIPIAVANLGLDIASDSLSQTDSAPDAPDDSFDAVMSTLDKTLEQIKLDITSEEETIQSKLTKNLVQIRTDRTGDITRRASNGSRVPDRPAILGIDDGQDLHRYDGRWEEIKIDHVLLEDIYEKLLPHTSSGAGAADELDAAQSFVIQSLVGSELVRDGDIGIGSSGPTYEINEVVWLLYELCGNLAWECENCAKSLRLGHQDLRENDAESQRRLDKHLKEIQDQNRPGSAFDPWSDPEPPVWNGPGKPPLY